MNEESPSLERLLRMRWGALLLGIIAMFLWGFAYFSETGGAGVPHQQAMYSYLYGFIFWFSITIGCFGFLLIQGAIKASWFSAIWRLLEAGGGPAMIVLMLVAFIPVLMPGGLAAVYSWSHAEIVAGDKVLLAKQFWLNPTGFAIRTIFILLVWVLWSHLMKRSTQRQDKTLDPKEWSFRANLGTPGIVMFFLTITLLSTDWLMSLEPHYYSTIYGLIFAIGSGLSAVSLAVMVVLGNSNQEPYRAIVTPKLTKDLGNILFMLTMLWAYMTLSQFLITWQGNLPTEVPYYLRRTGSSGGGDRTLDWHILSNLVIFFQFFVPFLALLAPRTKRVIRNLMAVAIIIFITRIFNVYWLIFPDVRAGASLAQSLTHWSDYAAFVGIGGIWFFFFVSQLTQAPLLPKFDTRLLEVEHA